MRKHSFLHALSLCLGVCCLCACGDRSIVYKPDIVQGNVLDEDEVALLRAGMSRDEVRAIIGSPLADNVFREDDWHYIHRVQPGGGTPKGRLVVLHFRGDALSHISGAVVPGLSKPDAAESQQRVVRVPDPPKVGLFGGLFKRDRKPPAGGPPEAGPDDGDEPAVPQP